MCTLNEPAFHQQKSKEKEDAVLKSFSVLYSKVHTIMGKTADLTVVQKTLIDTLHEEGKPQKVIAERAGCSQSAVSKHIHGKLTGREKCGRKRCTSNRDDRSLQRIVKQTRFKNLGELHKEWTEAGVSASRATTHRRVQEMGYKCRNPSVKPLLNQRQRQKRLTWVKEKKNWTVAQWSEVLSSDESHNSCHLLNMDPDDQYGTNESLWVNTDQPLDWSKFIDESQCEIKTSPGSAVSVGVDTSHVSQKKNPNEKEISIVPISDTHGVPKQEGGCKNIADLKVKVLPSPVLVKEQSEECSLQLVKQEEDSIITVEKEENEDWLNSDDEDVVKVTVPSLRSDKAYTLMESHNVQDCKNEEGEIEDCNTTSEEPEKAAYCNSKGRGLQCKSGRQTLKPSVTVQLDTRTGKTNTLSDFERGMIIGARYAGSSISEVAARLGFSPTTVSKVYKEYIDASKKS
uniref:Transposase Tc1-like domain-containing protein n=1 Tax=Esox lucius TaxID=8010 RepID=A0AAY5KDZ4_ESOLU